MVGVVLMMVSSFLAIVEIFVIKRDCILAMIVETYISSYPYHVGIHKSVPSHLTPR